MFGVWSAQIFHSKSLSRGDIDSLKREEGSGLDSDFSTFLPHKALSVVFLGLIFHFIVFVNKGMELEPPGEQVRPGNPPTPTHCHGGGWYTCCLSAPNWKTDLKGPCSSLSCPVFCFQVPLKTPDIKSSTLDLSQVLLCLLKVFIGGMLN